LILKIPYWNWIAYSGWTSPKLTVSKTYDTIFSDTKYQQCYFEIYRNIIVFCFSYQFWTVSNPLYSFKFMFYPLKWHETEYFSVKLVKNLYYVLGKWHETEYFSVKLGENLDYVLGKQYESEYFWVKPVKNWDYVWNWLSLFVNLKWLQAIQKISIYYCFHSNFHKKGSQNLIWYFLRFTRFVLYWRYWDLVSYLIGFLYQICDLTRPWGPVL
jgi:hypothetical protein